MRSSSISQIESYVLVPLSLKVFYKAFSVGSIENTKIMH